MLRPIVSRSVCVFTLFFSTNLCAFDVLNLSVKNKISKSDIVFSGTVLSIDELIIGNNDTIKFANIRVENSIKGKAKNSIIRFALSTGISELNPNCCALNSRYLIYARKGADSLYFSTNGPFGTYLIGN